MKLFILVALLAFGGWKWHASRSLGEFDANNTPIVRLYVYDKCGPPCAEGIALVKSKGIAFQVVNLDLNQPDTPDFKHWKKYNINLFPLLAAGKERAVVLSKADVISVLAPTFGESVLSNREWLYYQKHFSANGKPQVVMYSASWCPYCDALRSKLDADKVPYVEIEIDKLANKKEIMSTIGFGGYPGVWVGYEQILNTPELFESTKRAYKRVS